MKNHPSQKMYWDLLSSSSAFGIWTLTSFLCHKFAKMALMSVKENEAPFSLLAAPVILTTLQVITCFLTVQLSTRKGTLFLTAAISHTIATLTTNSSLALIFASSTMAVKLLEPVTAAVLQSLALKRTLRVDSVVSMLVIVAGAIIFVGDPFGDPLVLKGVVLAFLSNVALGIRNVAIKLDQSDDSETHLASARQLASYGSMVAVILVAVHGLETGLGLLPAGSSSFLAYGMASSVFHVTYSYVSTNVVLRYISVVSHALANILKRVLVVLLLHATGRRFASTSNWVGLLVCVCGLLLYNWRQISSMISSQSALDSPSNGFALESHNQGKVSESSLNTTRKIYSLYALLLCCLSPFVLTALMLSSARQPELDYGQQLRHGLIKWRNDQYLLKDRVTFQPLENPRASSLASFLEERLINIPQNTDQISPYLATTQALLNETERVHLNLLSDLIGGKKYAILIGAASFENKGDPAITVGQLKILGKLRVKLVFYINEENCEDEHYQRAVSVSRAYSPDSLVILMQGGGNIIGYEGANSCREKALHYFPEYQAVLLSQSVYMLGSERYVNRMLGIYCCNINLTILLRDRLSLSIASRLFANGTRLVLAPDMAFAIGAVRRFSPPFYDVLWLKRIDDERPRYDAIPSFPSGVTVHEADWWNSNWDTPKGTTTLETANNVLQNGLLFLQRGRVVVTERLHGHILSTLMDIPHVLLDNADQKLSSYYNTWTRSLANVRLAHSPQEAMTKALELLDLYKSSLPSVFPGMNIKEHPAQSIQGG